MASSEKMDPGGRSSFSQTCNLLSQYLKENGSFGDLGLGLTPKFSESKGAVNFLPMVGKSGRDPRSENLKVDVNNLPQLVGEETLNKSNGGQMTIFYAGQVMVFDDLPADKAKEIIVLASKSGARRAAFTPQLTPRSTMDSVAGAANTIAPFGLPERGLHVPQPALASDLPIARKNSLARFLEKRKDRITAKAPPPKPVKAEPWLGLAPQLPLQVERN